MFDSLWKFISYWYFRYLLVTELYMVEKWERVMIYIVFLMCFLSFALFNYLVVLNAVETVIKNQHDWIMMPTFGLIQSIM